MRTGVAGCGLFCNWIPHDASCCIGTSACNHAEPAVFACAWPRCAWTTRTPPAAGKLRFGQGRRFCAESPPWSHLHWLVLPRQLILIGLSYTRRFRSSTYRKSVEQRLSIGGRGEEDRTTADPTLGCPSAICEWQRERIRRCENWLSAHYSAIGRTHQSRSR